MTQALNLYQGDISDPVAIRPDLKNDTDTIDVNWKCFSSVETIHGEEIVAEREVTVKDDDNLNFLVVLNKDETALLDVGSIIREYVWVIKVTNNALSPEYSKEKRLPIAVRR